MKWRLNENSKMIVPGSVTDNWYFFNGRTFEQITPTVNGDNLEFTVSKNKAIISLIRTNFDVLDTSQLYGKIKSERIRDSLKISDNINAHRVTGDNLLTDGSFEEWDDEHNLTHWVKYTSGSSTINQESTDVIDGDYAVRLDADSNNSYVDVHQNFNLDVGIYQLGIYAKTTGGKGYIVIQDVDNGLYWNPNTQTWQSNYIAYNFENTDWQYISIIFSLFASTEISIKLCRGANASSQSIYFDNARLEKIGVIEHYDARAGLKVTADSTDIKIYAVDSQSSNQAELDKAGIG